MNILVCMSSTGDRQISLLSVYWQMYQHVNAGFLQHKHPWIDLQTDSLRSPERLIVIFLITQSIHGRVKGKERDWLLISPFHNWRQHVRSCYNHPSDFLCWGKWITKLVFSFFPSTQWVWFHYNLKKNNNNKKLYLWCSTSEVFLVKFFL